jgi:hypothetical protein
MGEGATRAREEGTSLSRAVRVDQRTPAAGRPARTRDRLPLLPLARAATRLNKVVFLARLTAGPERMVAGRTKAHELERLLPRTWQAEPPAAVVDA